jgi:predicted lipid-binding transport protein (Tim44 family)
MPSAQRHAARVLIALVLLTVALGAVLIAAPAALAAAGGGTSGFSGGGGGGGGGGGAHAFEIYLIFRVLLDIALLGHGKGAIVLAVLALVYAFYRWGLPWLRANVDARRQRGSAHRRETRRRERRVELAAAEAAEDSENPMFDPEHVRAAAGALFNQIQFAWDADDRIRLRGLIAPKLLEEWERRLDEFDRQGWRNRIEPLGEPTVEYVGLRQGGGRGDADDAGDRVVVRIDARLRDYVVDRQGRHIKRKGQFTETVRLREFWTLQRREDHWILASIEQGAEGAHRLKEQILPTAWSDTQALRDEAIVEQASADAPPADVKTRELVNVDFNTDARATALDLSLADGRFAPDVLEAAAHRAVAAWSEAIDGSSAELAKLAEPQAILELLYAGDGSRRTRLVVRGAQIKRIAIVALDPATDPPTLTIDAVLHGRRYLEDRDTAKVLGGDPARATTFTERWTLALTEDPATPWRIVSVGAPAGTRK